MLQRDQLRHALRRLDGQPFPAYRELVGDYDLGACRLHLDYVQGEPHGLPTRLRVSLEPEQTGLLPEDGRLPLHRLGMEDWLLRRLTAALARAADHPDGSGARWPEGELPPPAACLRVLVPGQQVLERSALAVRRGGIEIRLLCDLPVERGQVAGARAAAALDVALPAAVAAMLPGPADRASLAAHLALLEDQQELRAELARRGWVAFLADGAVLPRASALSDLPRGGPGVVRLLAPESLAATVRLPHRGTVRGLAVPAGVTLIAGGSYHGKSTLLRALALGVYDHVAGDGRELCATRAEAVAVGLDEGRAVAGCDISAFIGALPGADPAALRGACAGSATQAAGLREAIEAGATCLLLDEDSSAPALLGRTARGRELLGAGAEPVRPLPDVARALVEDCGVSLVLATGEPGPWLSAADTVIRLRGFDVEDGTAQARALREPEPAAPLPALRVPERVPAADALGAGPAERLRVRARGRRTVLVGDHAIDLAALTQVAEDGQAHALAQLVSRAARYCDGLRTLPQVLADVFADLDRLGFEGVSPWAGRCPGDYARPRPLELAAVLGRIPGLRLATDAPREPAPPRLRVRLREPWQEGESLRPARRLTLGRRGASAPGGRAPAAAGRGPRRDAAARGPSAGPRDRSGAPGGRPGRSGPDGGAAPRGTGRGAARPAGARRPAGAAPASPRAAAPGGAPPPAHPAGSAAGRAPAKAAPGGRVLRPTLGNLARFGPPPRGAKRGAGGPKRDGPRAKG